MSDKIILCLTIEIESKPADCGYSICFRTDNDFDPSSDRIEAWRDRVSKAVYATTDAPFTTDRKDMIEAFVMELEDINAAYPEYQIGSHGGVPAVQIQTTAGEKLEIEMNGPFDPDRDISYLRRPPSKNGVTGSGCGGFGMAAREDFVFAGPVSAGPAIIMPKRVLPRPPRL